MIAVRYNPKSEGRRFRGEKRQCGGAASHVMGLSAPFGPIDCLAALLRCFTFQRELERAEISIETK